MILEDETFEAFGYCSGDLLPQSNKPIIAVCDDCGKVRKIRKCDYRALCCLCSMKTEKIKAKISAAQKGNTNGLGYKFTKEQKARLSVAMKGKQTALGRKHTKEAKAKISGKKNPMFGKKDKNHPAWKGGRKRADARSCAKRRGLGHNPIYPVEEGEHEHHFTNEDVGGIPADVHTRLGGSRKKHRILVLQWLKANDKKKYHKVLCVLAKEPLYML